MFSDYLNVHHEGYEEREEVTGRIAQWIFESYLRALRVLRCEICLLSGLMVPNTGLRAALVRLFSKRGLQPQHILYSLYLIRMSDLELAAS